MHLSFDDVGGDESIYIFIYIIYIYIFFLHVLFIKNSQRALLRVIYRGRCVCTTLARERDHTVKMKRREHESEP